MLQRSWSRSNAKVVRDQEAARVGPVVRADADHVAGVEVAEDVTAHGLQRRRLDEDEQATVGRQVGPPDGGAELFLQLMPVFRARPCQGSFTAVGFSGGGCGVPPSQRK